MTERRSW